jgi:hypothetical protein
MQIVAQSDPTQRKTLGIALIAGSYTLLLGILGAAAVRFNELLAATGVDFINPGMAAVLALARAVGNLVFDHHAAVALGCAIFVASCALVGIVFGLKLLLRKPATAATP